jgi:hypothetical protein
MSERPLLDPYALLQALERARVSYVLVGALARVLHGSGEVTDGIDIAPSLRADNVSRLQAALEELGAKNADGTRFSSDDLDQRHIICLSTQVGGLRIVPAPAGTRGFDDLRRAARREALGSGLRVAVADAADLARMLEADPDDSHRASLNLIRQIAEREQRRGVSR